MSASDQDLSGLWMVPFADLMTTLVILFLAVFAYSYANKPPEYEMALAKMQQELATKVDDEEARRRAAEAAAALAMQKEVRRLKLREFGINVTSRYVHITLPSPVLFGEGSAALGPEAERYLKPLAEVFRDLKNPVQVDGHTDDKPVLRSVHRNNWELSAARAFSVIEYLIAQGLPAERFHARGYGEMRPVAGNDTPEGRRRNRRIEISLVRDYQEKEPPL